MANKLFKCNTEITNVAEWCIARNKKEAYEFMDKHWDDGTIMQDLYVKDYIKNNPDKSLDDFIEIFFIEENPEKDFVHPYGGVNEEPITKKVKEWIEEAPIIPTYLCHEKW